MAETHKIVTKVWIAPGCIVCDSCETDCPEVFDVQEQTCVIRPPALATDYIKPLTPSVITAAEGCPVDVIKYESIEVAGPAPWANQPAGEGVTASGSAPVAGVAHSGKVLTPLTPSDPKVQALISTSRISPSLSSPSGGLASTTGKSSEVNAGEDIIKAVKLPANAPADQRMALLAVGGAYQPALSMGDRIRAVAAKATNAAKSSRREFNLALVIAWGCIAAVGATFGAMFQDFFGPKVLKEPKKIWRAGKLSDYTQPGLVNESFKRTPAGSEGFWLVNLQPSENKLVALNTICTHLGCIPAWLQGDQKFKCPCHGSGYYITGVNFEGPTPRPLERFVITLDPEGYVVVDQSRVFRSELGEWDNPESFIPMV